MSDPTVGIEESLIEVLRDEIFKTITRPRDQKAARAICTYLLESAALNRYYVSMHKKALQDEWVRIRRDDAVTDYVLETVAQLRFRLGSVGFENLAQRVHDAMNIAEDSDCLIDHDMRSRFIDRQADITPSYLVANGWYMLLVLISFIFGVEDYTRLASIRAALSQSQESEG